jgi:drug/metabolite transporter (DMT)-like permease
MSTRLRRQVDHVALGDLLAAGARELPAVRYASACVAVAAAVALVRRSVPSVTVAVFGSTVMLAAMVLIALVSRVAAAHDRRLHESLRRPAIALAWAVVGATIVVLALLISTTFWGVPQHHDAARSALRATCYTGTILGISELDVPTRSGNRRSRSCLP